MITLPSELIEAFRDTLATGKYNLLLGSGVSLDSRDIHGNQLRSAEQLRVELCALKNISPTSTLQRAFSTLSSSDIDKQIIERYTCKEVGSSLHAVPSYIWRRIFTFNIDNVVESLYRLRKDAKQALVGLNFDSAFEPSPETGEVHLIHLHGSVERPTSGFVFSNAEYVRLMNTINPWMHLLSQLLATEAFIIAGTSLSEVDLEYYLSQRTHATPRKTRGPSILIEPYPDAATEKDCERYGLTLVKSTFEEFLAFVRQQLPAPPTVLELRTPAPRALFKDELSSFQLLRFFNDFALVAPKESPRSVAPSSFLYGKEPDSKDLDQHLDILRPAVDFAVGSIREAISSKQPTDSRLWLMSDHAGAGKTTILKRVGWELAKGGIPVLIVHTLTRIDIKNAVECLSAISSTVVLLVDDFAEHAEAIRTLLEHENLAGKVLAIGAERAYRREFVELVFDGFPTTTIPAKGMTTSELRQLIELYREFGLIGEPDAIRHPAVFASRLKGDLIAVAVCRILNDFRPLEEIVTSLWEATDARWRNTYLSAALARHCHVTGIRYSTLQSIAGARNPIDKLFRRDLPLSLTESPEHEDFVVPLNATIAEEVVKRVSETDLDAMLESFRSISSRIAVYVNRLTIRLRSPEARLAGRLFDADKIVRPLLKHRAEELFAKAQRDWEWNSRYWEQRALLTGDTDLQLAITYARHAVSLEEHPYPMTTLAKLLLRRMESGGHHRDSAFQEAVTILSKAIGIEGYRSRITVHPFSTLLSGAIRFIELGGQLSHSQMNELRHRAAEALHWFSKDRAIETLVRRLRHTLP